MRVLFSRGFLLVAGATVALALIALFAAYHQLGPKTPPDYDDLHVFDPAREGGHLKPDLDLLVMGEWLGSPVRFQTNSRGFRNTREFSHARQPGTRRILFVGDSFVDGMRTDQAHTIGFQLERALDGRDARRTEVMISGHTNPSNAWYYYQEHGRKYRPQLVLLGLTLGNDVTWHNYGGGMQPAVDRRGLPTLRVAYPARQGTRHRAGLLLPARAYEPPGLFEELEQFEFRLREGLATRFGSLSQLVPPEVQSHCARRRAVCAAGVFTSLGLFYRPQMRAIEEMFADLEATLRGFDARVRAEGARFLVVLFPLRFQVSDRDWDLLHRRYALAPERFDLGKPNRRIMTFCRAQGIECVDATIPMREANGSSGPLFRGRGDMHFNEAGQAVVANLLASYLHPR